MGVIDAPQWLLPAFSRSVWALGTTAPAEQIRAAGEHLVALWSTPDRRFHNLRHLIDMLARVDELADESHHPDIMRVATWYHGCVFSAETEQVNRRNGGEDEAASAAFGGLGGLRRSGPARAGGARGGRGARVLPHRQPQAPHAVGR